MTLSQRVFEELKKQKKKQKDLAAYIGISTSAVSDWKKKGTNPSAENISAIADFLEVSIDYLLTGTENHTKKLTDDEQRLLKLYNLLTDMEKGEMLGELKAMTKARSTDNAPHRIDIQLSQRSEKALARDKSNPFREAPTPEQQASFTPVPEDSDL